MEFPAPLLEARLLKREKRFFGHCVLPDGSEVIAHCPNSGSMRGNQDPMSPVWLLDLGPEHLAGGRKLRYKWVMVESRGVRVVIDTNCANGIVAEALREGKIAGLPREFRAEHRVGASRLDFFFPGPPEVFMEVKSVSMGEGSDSAFPDAVTERGQKHLRELMGLLEQGKRAVLFFLVTRERSLRMRPAAEIDPVYARLLAEAVGMGLEVLVYGTRMSSFGLEVGEKGVLELP
jgi:sugar fermentation stimulation protein A